MNSSYTVMGEKNKQSKWHKLAWDKNANYVIALNIQVVYVILKRKVFICLHNSLYFSMMNQLRSAIWNNAVSIISCLLCGSLAAALASVFKVDIIWAATHVCLRYLLQGSLSQLETVTSTILRKQRYLCQLQLMKSFRQLCFFQSKATAKKPL